MKKLFLLLVLAFVSCEIKREYKYSSINCDGEEMEAGKEINEFTNDTLAFLDAYMNFCLSKKTYTEICNFKLIKGNIDLRNLEFKNKLKKQDSIERLADSINKITTEKINKIKESSTISIYQSTENACIMAEDFIKAEFRNRATVDVSTVMNCSSERNGDGSYTVLTKASGKNDFGVEKEYIFKVRLGFKGGDSFEQSNWELIKIQSEEYN